MEARFIKALLAPVQWLLVHSYRAILRGAPPPMHWRDAHIWLSPKVPGSARLDDYRPIALGQLDMKLLTGPLTQRITEVLTRHGVVSDWQQGALPGSNTGPPLFMAQRQLQRGRPNYAFDTAPHGALHLILRHPSVPPDVIDLLLFLHTCARLRIVTAHGLTQPVYMLRGVRQGNPESPLLYALLLEPLLRAQGHRLRPPGGAEHGLIQAYIDDLLVVAHKLQHFIEGVEAVAAYLGLMGMELNPRNSPMATTERVRGLQLRLCPQLENPWHWVPAADSVPYVGLLAVAQQGQQNPQWVVCMFSPADAHIVVCDPERLPGPEAVIRVADCTCRIVKALREGEHHALLLQVRLKDNARAARPGVWQAAAHPADLELQLALPTAVYHWLQAFHDLRWRGKPDRQIGSTHWQRWLQADAQRDAIRGHGPAPATRALDAAAPGRTLAPHTVPLASLPFEPAAEGAIRKSVPLPPARGATEPTKCPLCADKYYTSGAMLEHLAWHAVHAAAPADDKEAATNSLRGRARRSPWHAPYTRRPPPQAADHADRDEEAPGAASGTGGAAPPGSMSIPGGLALLAPLAPPVPRAPLWAPLGTGSAEAAHPDALAAPANPAAMPMRDS